MWAINAEQDQTTTLKTATEATFGSNLSYAYGCDILDDYFLLGDFGFMLSERMEKRDSQKDMEEALKVASEAEVIVVAIGEHTMQSGEAASRTKLAINKLQIELLEKLSTLNKPIVCFLFNGRPLVLDNILDKTDALVEAWFPGTEGTLAIAILLAEL